MVYTVKLIFNQKLLCTYDSRLGKYVGFKEFGIRKQSEMEDGSALGRAAHTVLSQCEMLHQEHIKKGSRKCPPNISQSNSMLKVLLFCQMHILTHIQCQNMFSLFFADV